MNDKPFQSTLQLKYEMQINADMHTLLLVTQKQSVENPGVGFAQFY